MKRTCRTCKWKKDSKCINANTILTIPNLMPPNIMKPDDSTCSNWKPKKRETCKECEFWKRFSIEHEGEPTGECIKNAPRSIYAEVYGDLVNDFGITKPLESCGDFMPVEDDK